MTSLVQFGAQKRHLDRFLTAEVSEVDDRLARGDAQSHPIQCRRPPLFLVLGGFTSLLGTHITIKKHTNTFPMLLVLPFKLLDASFYFLRMPGLG